MRIITPGINPFTTLGLGGASPIDPAAAGLRCKPVLAGLKSKLIHVMKHDGVRPGMADTGMHYVGAAAGGTAEAPVWLGIIPFGLGDGSRVPAEGQSPAAVVGGVAAPVVAVSLEYTTLDLTAVVAAGGGAAPSVGATVVLGEKEIGGSGGSLAPVGLFLRTSVPFIWRILSAFLPA